MSDCGMVLISPDNLSKVIGNDVESVYLIDVEPKSQWEVWQGLAEPAKFRGPRISIPMIVTNQKEVEEKKKEYSHGVYLPRPGHPDFFLAGFYRAIM